MTKPKPNIEEEAKMYKTDNDIDPSRRLTIDEADGLDDADTADLFTEISRGIDKWLWFVEAHAQASK